MDLALREMDCEDVPKMIWRRVEPDTIKDKLDAGLELFLQKDESLTRNKILSSTYCPRYKFVKTTDGCEPFWNDENEESWTKETWSRLRCGNIGRHNKKGYKAWDCRLCHSEPETIEHLLICREARMLCTPKIADKIQALTDGKYDADRQFLVKELLRGLPNI